jgi:hypothetical protein
VEDKQALSYGVVLFPSVNGALLAERLLKKKGIAHKLIPVPRHLSSDCGVCIRFHTESEAQIKKVLMGKVEIQAFCVL